MEDSLSWITNYSATCCVQNQLLSPVLLQTTATILQNPNTKQRQSIDSFQNGLPKD